MKETNFLTQTFFMENNFFILNMLKLAYFLIFNKIIYCGFFEVFLRVIFFVNKIIILNLITDDKLSLLYSFFLEMGSINVDLF